MNLFEKKRLFLWPQGKAGFKTQNVQMPLFAEFDVLVWKTRFSSHAPANINRLKDKDWEKLPVHIRWTED